MKILAGLPAKFYSTGMTRFRQIPAGIRGALIRPQFLAQVIVLQLEWF